MPEQIKLLISGSNLNQNTIGYFISSRLSKSIDFEILKFHDYFTFLTQSNAGRLIYRIFPWFITFLMNRSFTRQCRSFRPHVALIFKGMEISSEALKVARSLSIKLVNYNFDHPFHHYTKGTGNQNVINAIPYYDLHISYSSKIAEELRRKYGAKTAVIPFGHHLDPKQYEEVISSYEEEILALCFVGNPDSHRVSVIKDLISAGMPVHVFGFGWEREANHIKELVIHPPRKAKSFWREPLEFWRVLRRYRVQLNFFRPHNEGSHNMRSYEVPAVGGILLSPYSEEQAGYFQEDKEVYFYRHANEIYFKAKTILELSESEAAQIRQLARHRSIDYSYWHRTQVLENLLFEICDPRQYKFESNI